VPPLGISQVRELDGLSGTVGAGEITSDEETDDMEKNVRRPSVGKRRKNHVQAATVADWLLAAFTPSIRYLALRHLLDRPDTDDVVMAAWQAMKTCSPIPAILVQQTEAGNWAGERSYYTPKYTSTHWSMLLLTELAADGTDPHLRQGAMFMLSATEGRLDEALRTRGQGFCCFWGNLLRYAQHCGLQDDARVQDMIDTLAREALETGWCCPINDDLPCAWGVARALWGLAAIPRGQRAPQTEAAIQKGVTWLLEVHRLVEADYPTSGRVHPLWFRLNFPLFYQADILFVLRVLAVRRTSGGRWRGASPFRQRTWAALADREEVDRWVTLHAEIVFRQAGE
jgi:hypothetical protein